MSAKTDAIRRELHNVPPENNLTTVLRFIDPLLTNIDVVVIGDLPTADPHVSGQIWNNAGVPTISSG